MIEPRYISAGRHIIDETLYADDGDSFLVDFDPGFGLRLTSTSQVRQIVRVVGVDCPETRPLATREAGIAARDFTRAWMRDATCIEREFPLEIQTVEVDGFGRWLSVVRRLIDGRSLADDLIAAGHDTGRRWEGGAG